MEVNLNFKKVVVWILLLLLPSLAGAQGFNENYRVFSGFSNNDNLTDLYITSDISSVRLALSGETITTPDTIYLHGPGPITTPIAVESTVVPAGSIPTNDFILENNGDGSFSIVESNVSDLSAWQEVDVEPRFTDFNLDGLNDLLLNGISSIIGGAFNQIVYAPSQTNQRPTAMTSMDENFISFFRDMLRWQIDRNYFNNPPVVLPQPPAIERIRYFLSLDVSPVATSNLLARCGSNCRVTTTLPSLEDCVRPGILTDVDEVGNTTAVGRIVVNVCTQFPIFIVETEEGEGEEDFTVFNERAREVAEVLDRLNENCPLGVLENSELNVVNEALDSVIGTAVNFGASLFFNLDNSIPHPSFGDEGKFDTTDPTYHHYDVSTRLCSFLETGCDVSLATSGQAVDNGTRLYTLPSFGLEATTPLIDGSFEFAFAPWDPRVNLSPSSIDYVSPIGRVSQQFLTSVDQIEGGRRYFGTVQNITDALHAVFPGLISRTLEVRDDGLYGFTHGVGLNRAFCSSILTNTVLGEITTPGGPLPRARVREAVKFLQVIGAVANDVFGQLAFENLDINMRREFREQFGFSQIDRPLTRAEMEQLESARETVQMFIPL